MTDCILPIAEKSRLGFASFNLDAEGLLGNEDGIWRFTEIKLRPVVTILKEQDRDRAITSPRADAE